MQSTSITDAYEYLTVQTIKGTIEEFLLAVRTAYAEDGVFVFAEYTFAPGIVLVAAIGSEQEIDGLRQAAVRQFRALDAERRKP